MSNKTQLQTNNTALDGYIARINAAKETAASLPEAGGSGGSVNIKNIQVTGNFYGDSLWYSQLNEDTQTISYINSYEQDSLLILENSLLIIEEGTGMNTFGSTEITGASDSFQISSYYLNSNKFVIIKIGTSDTDIQITKIEDV